MRSLLFSAAMAALLSLEASKPAHAAGWSLLPGSRDSTEDSTQGQSGRRSAGELMTPAEPTLMKRMKNGTRSFFANTKRMLTPSRASQPTAAVSHRKKSTKKSFGLGSLFQPAEPDVPQTMDDWMRLKRPEAL